MNNYNQIPDLLFHTAQGFYDIGFNCAYNVNKDETIKGVQRIAPGAVNLGFAAELLLKGVLLITTKKPIRGHHLLGLFKELPSESRKKIEERFNYQKDNNKEMDSLSSMSITIKKDSDSKSDKTGKKTKSLLTFLKAHNKTFENWRYLHEIGQNGYSYEIDFKLMDCFIKSLIDYINQLPRKQSLFLKKV